jgi:hypothetical protein
MNSEKLWDNGGRRSGSDRRKFLYIGHFPEQRCGKERRSGFDRRRERYFYSTDIERRENLKF